MFHKTVDKVNYHIEGFKQIPVKTIKTTIYVECQIDKLFGIIIMENYNKNTLTPINLCENILTKPSSIKSNVYKHNECCELYSAKHSSTDRLR